MKKRILCLLLAIFMIVPLFAACDNGTTEDPTKAPTEAPTDEPTEAPTDEPTEAPTEEPTEAPTDEPTEAPTEDPTEAPTDEPTEAPTEDPTEAPTEEPVVTPAETLDVVVNGASEYKIVISANATTPEKNAANELQEYIETISGCKIEIVDDSTEVSAKEIVVGKTNRETSGEFDRDELGEDGFIIKTVDDMIYLVGGGDRGTIYAVYEFLEAYLGCRFFTTTIEKIPSTANISITEIEEDKQIPVFEYRSVYWADYRRSDDMSVKRKINGKDGLSEDWGGSIDYAAGIGGHSFMTLVPISEYYAEHPEYYRLKTDGTRDNDPDRSQLCLTNPEVLEIVITKVKKYLSENPTAELISVSQMDTGSEEFCSCVCDNCLAVDAEEGSPSGAIIRFVNAVADAIKDEYPNVKIHTLAYRYSRTAPAKTQPRDNVVVQLCSIENCFNHSVDSGCPNMDIYSEPTDPTFYDTLSQWSKICENLYVWDYTTDYHNYNLTFPNFEAMLENARIMADNNVIGLFEQGNHQTTSGEFSELRCYLLSKVLWDPYMTEEEYYGHMNEFLEYVYGDGWTYIREYIDLAEEVADDIHFNIYAGIDEIFPITTVENDDRELPAELTLEMIMDYENTDWSPYISWYTQIIPNEIVTKGEELFAKALAAATTDSQKMMIDKASIQVDYIKSYYLYQVYSRQARGNISDLIKNFFNENEVDMDTKEVTKLRNAVAKHVSEIYKAKYLEFNTELYSKIKNYGIRVREQQIANDPILSNIPSNWF